MRQCAAALLVALAAAERSDIPSVRTLGAQWEVMPLRAMPLIVNFVGGVNLQRSVVGLGPLTLAPYLGNFVNSTFRVGGEAVVAEDTGWAWCEGTRRGRTRAGATVENAVRAPFAAHGVLQTWDVEAAGSNVSVDAWLDGPLFRRCDLGAASSECGWNEALPINRSEFKRSVVGGVALSEDSLSPAVAATAVFAEGGSSSVAVDGDGFRLVAAGGARLRLLSATAVAATAAEARLLLAGLARDRAAFRASWDAACDDWDARWRGAFDAAGSFGGNLPALATSEPALDRLYHWAALSLVALDRVDYAAKDEFVISEGPSNAYDGGANMGGSGQFLWDLSFSPVSLTLLAPASTRRLVDFVVANSRLDATPVAIPQTWDAYDLAPPGNATYCFDYAAAFFLVSQYATYAGDVDFLTTNATGGGATPLEYLKAVAWAWTAFDESAASPYLRDYGGDKRLFLEAVPTYRDVVPALQLSNAGMLLSYARLLETLDLGTPGEIADARGNASAIVDAALRHQYVEGEGFWRCLGVNGSSVEVRSLADFVYAAFGVGLVGGDAARLFPEAVRREMADFFFRELATDGWARALSLEDDVMRNVDAKDPSTTQKLAFRPDWTGTGAYGGLPGFAVDALADLTQALDAPLALLRNLTKAATATMPAQGVAVTTPPYVAAFLDGGSGEPNGGKPVPEGPYAPAWPEWFDGEEAWEPPFWPNTERALSSPPASIADAFVRSVFGWRPDWAFLKAGVDAAAAIDGALFLPRAPRRGFSGTLRAILTPFGPIDITASEAGLAWAFSKA